MTRRVRAPSAALLCTITLLAPARGAAAADKTWVGASGNWSVAANWSPSGRPQSGDNVFLTSGDLIGRTVTYDLAGPFHFTYGNVTIQTQQSASMELRQPGTPLEAASLSVSSFNDFGSAHHTVTDGGWADIGSLTIGASGSISVASGGAYHVRDGMQFNGAVAVEAGSTFTVGGTYIFTGGTFAGPLTVRDTGTLRLGAGPFGATITNFGALVIDASTSVQGLTSHAAVTVPAGRLFEADFVDQRGATLAQAGDVRASSFTVQNGATWAQTGGAGEGSETVVGGDAGPSTFTISAGTHSLIGPLYVGQKSAGSFIQSGGTVRALFAIVGGSPSIGFGRGYYRLSAGSLGTGQLMVGSENSLGGTFEQTGGSSDFLRLNVNVNSTTSGVVRLSGGNLRTTTSSINNGTIEITGGSMGIGGSLDGAGSVSVTGSGSLSLQRVRQNSLFIGGNARVFNTSVTGRPATNRLGSLTFEEAGGAVAGTLDLDINSLVIDYAGGTGASPINSVRRYLRSARGSGSWNGTGLTSAFSSSTGIPLGYIESADLLGPGGGAFGELSVDDTAVLVRATFYGDANLDSRVNLLDFNRLASNFGGAGKIWSQGDFNYDGDVNLLDFNLLAANFGRIAAGPGLSPGDWAALAGAVPEPSAALLVTLAMVAVTRRARRRRRCA